MQQRRLPVSAQACAPSSGERHITEAMRGRVLAQVIVVMLLALHMDFVRGHRPKTYGEKMAWNRSRENEMATGTNMISLGLGVFMSLQVVIVEVNTFKCVI